jgi:hypothetical protein
VFRRVWNRRNQRLGKRLTTRALSRPQRRSNDGQHRCGASRCPHRLPRRPGEAGRGSGRGRELDGAAERCCYAQEQESAEVGARSEPSPRPLPVWRSVLARGPGRRLGSARLRAKGARLPTGRIRSRGMHAKFLVGQVTSASSNRPARAEPESLSHCPRGLISEPRAWQPFWVFQGGECWIPVPLAPPISVTPVIGRLVADHDVLVGRNRHPNVDTRRHRGGASYSARRRQHDTR